MPVTTHENHSTIQNTKQKEGKALVGAIEHITATPHGVPYPPQHML